MSDSASRAEIESYRNQVLQGKISCELPPCPFCGALPDGFRRHEARRRIFYVIGGQWVEIVWCRITRWKCSHCGKIRTQHPPFALPYKRYTRQILMGFSQAYLEDEASSYRKAVPESSSGQALEDGLPIGFASKPGEEEIDERQLAHSTLYRWVTTLGGFKEVLRSALDLILQKNPASAICRGLVSLKVAPSKYVKAAREGVLRRCRQLLHLEGNYRHTFGTSIFPYLATRCAWR